MNTIAKLVLCMTIVVSSLYEEAVILSGAKDLLFSDLEPGRHLQQHTEPRPSLDQRCSVRSNSLMIRISRRHVLAAGAAGAATQLTSAWAGSSGLPSEALTNQEQALPASAKTRRNGRIHQSVARWCYQQIPLDQLCVAASGMGLAGIDLLQPEEYEIPRRYGLVCAMGYAGGGEINKGLNRVENHAAIEAGLRKNMPLAARAGVPNVITFSGIRNGLSDEEGARNTIAGLRPLAKIAEDIGVTLCLELLNSKVDHPGYMADHTAWGVKVCEQVGSPHIKLLYDIYHMQIMEGDLIATIRQHGQWFAHYHTGGVPGRHELDDTQEVQWDGVMRAIAATGFTGYVAHEFIPTRDPLTSLRQAVNLCDV
jgi:hydroxypyruvate isomerase